MVSSPPGQAHPAQRARIGVSVTFAALSAVEQQAVEEALRCASDCARNWEMAFAHYGLKPIDADICNADLLVYLGESSRFESVAGALTRRVPVVFVKSTVENLLERPAGGAKRWRMSTGVLGIAQALAAAAPLAPSVDWMTLPWPAELAGMAHLDPAEQRYVDISLGAFREAAERRGISWQKGLPQGMQPFSVFLTMHDPAAALLAIYALNTWPQCTVIAADGMSSTCAPDGNPWPDRLIRVRHWSALSRSQSNRCYRAALGKPLPDIDSPGMLFGTLFLLDALLGAGTAADNLEVGARAPGPLGLMRLTGSGHPAPERVVILRGQTWKVQHIKLDEVPRGDVMRFA
jgi:hypothetical protein